MKSVHGLAHPAENGNSVVWNGKCQNDKNRLVGVGNIILKKAWHMI